MLLIVPVRPKLQLDILPIIVPTPQINGNRAAFTSLFMSKPILILMLDVVGVFDSIFRIDDRLLEVFAVGLMECPMDDALSLEDSIKGQ